MKNLYTKIILTVLHGGMSCDMSQVFKTQTHFDEKVWRQRGTQYWTLNESALFADPSESSCKQVGAKIDWKAKKFGGTVAQRIEANCMDLVSAVGVSPTKGVSLDTKESLTIIAKNWRLDAVKETY
jgi:hypothetical protein